MPQTRTLSSLGEVHRGGGVMVLEKPVGMPTFGKGRTVEAAVEGMFTGDGPKAMIVTALPRGVQGLVLVLLDHEHHDTIRDWYTGATVELTIIDALPGLNGVCTGFVDGAVAAASAACRLLDRIHACMESPKGKGPVGQPWAVALSEGPTVSGGPAAHMSYRLVVSGKPCPAGQTRLVLCQGQRLAVVLTVVRSLACDSRRWGGEVALVDCLAVPLPLPASASVVVQDPSLTSVACPLSTLPLVMAACAVYYCTLVHCHLCSPDLLTLPATERQYYLPE
eukprot:gene11914-2173_t